jgi:hypothetical protein
MIEVHGVEKAVSTESSSTFQDRCTDPPGGSAFSAIPDLHELEAGKIDRLRRERSRHNGAWVLHHRIRIQNTSDRCETRIADER